MEIIKNTAGGLENATEAQVKQCPECGSEFTAGGRGQGKTFCAAACRVNFNNRMKAEGAPLAALVKAWTLTRHAKPGSRDAEVCRFARSQITAIASILNDDDQDKGRPSVIAYVETLMASGTLYLDRRR